MPDSKKKRISSGENRYGLKPYDERKIIICKDTGEKVSGDKYLSSKHWQQMRIKAYSHYNGICQRCGDSIPIGLANVHHRTYKRFGNENLSDLILYCNRCHRIIHKNKELEKSRNKSLNSFVAQMNASEKAEALKLLKEHFGSEYQKSV